MKKEKSTGRLFEYYQKIQKKTFHQPKNEEELKVVLELLLDEFYKNKEKVYDRVFELSEMFYKNETYEKLNNDYELLKIFVGWKSQIEDAIMQDANYGIGYFSPGKESEAYDALKNIIKLFFNH